MSYQRGLKVTLRSDDDLDKIKERTFTVTPTEPLRVGRSTKTAAKDDLTSKPSNAYIDSPVVSRTHAEFIVEDRSGLVLHLYIKDLKSTHGTFVDGKVVGPYSKAELRSGSTVRIGTDVTHSADVFIAPKYTVSFQEISVPATPPTDTANPKAGDMPFGYRAPSVSSEDPFPATYAVPDESDGESVTGGDLNFVDRLEIMAQAASSVGPRGSQANPVEIVDDEASRNNVIVIEDEDIVRSTPDVIASKDEEVLSNRSPSPLSQPPEGPSSSLAAFINNLSTLVVPDALAVPDTHADLYTDDDDDDGADYDEGADFEDGADFNDEAGFDESDGDRMDTEESEGPEDLDEELDELAEPYIGRPTLSRFPRPNVEDHFSIAPWDFHPPQPTKKAFDLMPTVKPSSSVEVCDSEPSSDGLFVGSSRGDRFASSNTPAIDSTSDSAQSKTLPLEEPIHEDTEAGAVEEPAVSSKFMAPKDLAIAVTDIASSTDGPSVVGIKRKADVLDDDSVAEVLDDSVAAVEIPEVTASSNQAEVRPRKIARLRRAASAGAKVVGSAVAPTCWMLAGGATVFGALVCMPESWLA